MVFNRASEIAASSPNLTFVRAESSNVGFRVVRVPEPGQVLLVVTGGLVLAAARPGACEALPRRLATVHAGARRYSRHSGASGG